MITIAKAGLTRRVALLLLLALVLPLTGQTPYLSQITATVPNGQAITASIDLKDQPILAIRMPASWTTANITFQSSQNGTDWLDVYNMFGDEFTVTAAAGRVIVMSPFDFQWGRYIKIRSGTTGTPVNQSADRTIILITRRVL